MLDTLPAPCPTVKPLNVASFTLVNVVNAPVFGVVLPIVGGLDKSNVPPSVIVPVVVIGPPVNVIPLTVPAVAIEVTVPTALLIQTGKPAANASIWPSVPLASIAVVLAAVW